MLPVVNWELPYSSSVSCTDLSMMTHKPVQRLRLLQASMDLEPVTDRTHWYRVYKIFFLMLTG